MKIIVPLSGGKDSQASLLWAIEKYGVENIESVFCDTKWESKITYNHINYLVDKSEVKFTSLVSSKYDGMVDMAVKKGRFPSSQSRFCTVELKVKPMIDYVLSQTENLIIVQGIRADESSERSKMEEVCRYFKYYFQPYQTNSMIVEKYSNMKTLSLVQKNKLSKAKLRLEQGKEDPKFHTYRKKDVFEWCKKYDDTIQRPFFNATGDEVIYYSLNRGFDINPMYFKGFSRVGCYPCVMCKQSEIDLIIKNDEKRINEIRENEALANSTFFKPDTVPPRYRIKKEGVKKKITPIDSVVKYSKDRHATEDMFEDTDDFQCKSVYNICE
ncbi:phosphoadenosine phosphosulfate reductase family protein [Myroides sp. LoEW2-1]|uniref:phosphoadenosine phosphosulfate reductase domain-containing protein n=1 Tax=Myroides sp. LoEW2-1 TaxID=2683192 RepID=UPI0013657242|nr:phosphoadenosine phosphosulfate reductase family protein [Myroides sp. LoEW2-1]